MSIKINPASAHLYSYVTNRAYLTSLSMRSILRQLDKDINVQLISHSFGAVITTGIVLDPFCKMKPKDTNTHFDRALMKVFRDTASPERRISLFLSAPGIPGVTTFRPIGREKNKDHFFYIRYNHCDRVLNKRLIPFARFFTDTSKRNSTTLGCNWKGEIDRVERVFGMAGLQSNFSAKRTSTRTNHDYFCYRRQPDFQDFFADFARKNKIL